MSGVPFVLPEFRVRYAETDQMGVVYHGAYFPWLEMARVEQLRAAGHTYADWESAGYRLPVLHCEATYERATAFDELIEVRCWLVGLSAVRLRFRYEVWARACTDSAATLRTHALTEHAIIGPNGTARRLPPTWLQALRPHLSTPPAEPI